ncbi:MAG: hypothetical protein ACLGIE_14975 [Alphaproteobacteria bacterium]
MKKAVVTIPLLALALLAACGPMTLAEAERQCFERARLAQQPRGEFAVGVDSDGRAGAGLELNISSDYLMGRDPAAVYETCVMAKAGEPPSRPLYARPDWKG